MSVNHSRRRRLTGTRLDRTRWVRVFWARREAGKPVDPSYPYRRMLARIGSAAGDFGAACERAAKAFGGFKEAVERLNRVETQHARGSSGRLASRSSLRRVKHK